MAGFMFPPQYDFLCIQQGTLPTPLQSSGAELRRKKQGWFMFVINFSPNTVIPYVELAQLSGFGWELGSRRKGGWPQTLHQPGLQPSCQQHSLWAVSQMSPPSGTPFLISAVRAFPPENLCHFICTFFLVLNFPSPSLHFFLLFKPS